MNLRLKMMLLGTIPLIIVIGLISLMFFVQTRSLAANEIALIEQTLIDEKKSALKSHISLALAAIKLDYEQALTGDKTALKRIAETLTSMEYGDNGYFYVYVIYGTSFFFAMCFSITEMSDSVNHIFQPSHNSFLQRQIETEAR